MDVNRRTSGAAEFSFRRELKFRTGRESGAEIDAPEAYHAGEKLGKEISTALLEGHDGGFDEWKSLDYRA
jgi:hypothetical protein